jgi:hypothetical protein
LNLVTDMQSQVNRGLAELDSFLIVLGEHKVLAVTRLLKAADHVVRSGL